MTFVPTDLDPQGFRLLTRDAFREGVFARDGHLCVICGDEGKDAHHILERRLWPDGGYYLANGATLCAICHLQAEGTLLSVEEIREAAKITRFPLPEHLYTDEVYDKWGNPVLPDGHRLRGELFGDESVQKVLRQHIDVDRIFRAWVKYPRTYHLPWSPGATKDDRTLPDTSHFEGQEVVVTVKMDGEQTTMYRDHIHARSVDSGGHPSRDRVRALQGQIGWEIPEGWRVCGENLYAVHSIHYYHLPAHFMVFSVWDETNLCLPWEDTLEWCDLLGLTPVPTLYRGRWDESIVRGLFRDVYENDPMEGYVVRLARGFHYRDFPQAVAKFVRPNHVQTHGHWMRSQLVPNGIKRGGIIHMEGEPPE